MLQPRSLVHVHVNTFYSKMCGLANFMVAYVVTTTTPERYACSQEALLITHSMKADDGSFQISPCIRTVGSEDQGVASSIPVWSHTFVEIDHEMISTIILLPSTDSFKVTRESMCTNYWLTACSSLPRKK